MARLKTSKKAKLRHLRVPIFTEEYCINIYIGEREDLHKIAAKWMDCSVKACEKDFDGNRGKAYNLFPEANPLILIDANLKAHIGIATIAHEASHAMDFIEKHIGIKEENGEFHAHGIAAVMRSLK